MWSYMAGLLIRGGGGGEGREGESGEARNEKTTCVSNKESPGEKVHQAREKPQFNNQKGFLSQSVDG